MTIATTSSTARRSLLQHIPKLALALAVTAAADAGAPIGWRAGWWHFRFSLLTLMALARPYRDESRTMSSTATATATVASTTRRSAAPACAPLGA